MTPALLLVVAAAPPFAASVKPTDGALHCTASDPALGLTKHKGGSGNKGHFFAVDRQKQLAKLCQCTSVDYFYIYDCPDCTQATMDGCKLTTITKADPIDGQSLTLQSMSSVYSLRGLKKLSGKLIGGLYVADMLTLATLDGLEGISGLGTDLKAISFYRQKPTLQTGTSTKVPNKIKLLTNNLSAPIEKAVTVWKCTLGLLENRFELRG